MVCKDDSDCMKLDSNGDFACFGFLCYPWKDDSMLAPVDRISTCRKDRDCDDNKKCYRHNDRRRVSKGLCFDELRECGLVEYDEICPQDQGCCGGSCCEKKYFEQYIELPCHKHEGCENLGLGKFCCPRKGRHSVCCNTDPNPPPPIPTTVAPRKGS